MDIRKSFAPFASVVIVATFICVVPSLTFGAGTEKKTPEPKPRPDTTKKVYTNDDLGWHAATPAPVTAIRPGQTQDAIQVPSSSNPLYAAAALRAPLNQQQDPQWYSGQLARLEAQLAAVDTKEASLLAFRSSDNTQSTDLPVGLVLNAPCEGITTDNLIAQLDAQRREINEQIDNLGDTARSNGLPPGIVEQASSAAPVQPTAEQERAELASRYQQLSGNLAETQAVTNDMQEQAAAQGITLIPPTPGNGGNMTTDLLERLNAESAGLQDELGNIEDNARTLGAQPGDLR